MTAAIGYTTSYQPEGCLRRPKLGTISGSNCTEWKLVPYSIFTIKTATERWGKNMDRKMVIVAKGAEKRVSNRAVKP